MWKWKLRHISMLIPSKLEFHSILSHTMVLVKSLVILFKEYDIADIQFLPMEARAHHLKKENQFSRWKHNCDNGQNYISEAKILSSHIGKKVTEKFKLMKPWKVICQITSMIWKIQEVIHFIDKMLETFVGWSFPSPSYSHIEALTPSVTVFRVETLGSN